MKCVIMLFSFLVGIVQSESQIVNSGTYDWDDNGNSNDSSIVEKVSFLKLSKYFSYLFEMWTNDR